MTTQLRAAAKRVGLSGSFIAYGSVSVVALLIELAVLHAAISAGLYQPVAVSCGYIASSIFQFCALRYVVFKVAHKTLTVQALAYVVGQLALLGLLIVAVAALTRFFPLSTMQARLICVPTLFPVNFLVSRHFIFRR